MQPSLMASSSSSQLLLSSCPRLSRTNFQAKQNRKLACDGGRRTTRSSLGRRWRLDRVPTTSTCAMDGATAADLAPVHISWQIVVGAFAGITPFVVAGIAFSKRIVAQRRCGTCGGSGLVLREEYYTRCPSCGGFLPWQSWKRFFTG
ncbi:hypothetical protein AXF42_Ash002368 [Apostasia shenzhenica]|uniref:Viral late gene transcription factor 3 zinc ribbon domain-containing protein n=1 Tax=Apostasia shenzhenica TaxID=1088818 RepID=A0A2I0ANF4_9ASPA|nr:hypothetical protein AXF42_Ash002368 [Apostasia shenzhenica]